MSTVTIDAGSLILTEREQSRRLRAHARDDQGNDLADAHLVWHSSRPDVVRVGRDGLVTALTDVGYAKITAEHAGSTSDPLPVIVARLARRSRVLDDAEVQWASAARDEALIRPDRSSPPLTVGDLVMHETVSGRITDLSPSGDALRVRTEQVPMTEIFEAVHIEETFRVRLGSRISSDGVELFDHDAASRRPGASTTPRTPMFFSSPIDFVPQFKCEAGVGVDLADISIQPGAAIGPNSELLGPSWEEFVSVNYSFGPFTPVTLTVSVTDTVTYSRSSDSLTINKISYSGSCYQKLPGGKVGPFALLPPYGLFFDVTPKIGLELSVTTDSVLTVLGPSVAGSSFTYTATASFSDGSWASSAGLDLDTGVVTPPSVTLSDPTEIETKLSPFVGMDVGFTLADLVLDQQIGRVDFIRPKGHVTLKHKIAAPIDFLDPAYTGPSWQITTGLKVWVGLKITGALTAPLEFLGIFGQLGIAESELTDTLLLESPAPEIDALQQSPPAQQSFAFSASPQGFHGEILTARISYFGSGALPPSFYQGWTVGFFATPGPSHDAQLVAAGVLGADGTVTVFWNMQDTEPGVYGVRAYLHADPGWLTNTTGLVLPYVSPPVPVVVSAPEASIAIDVPSEVTVNAGVLHVEATYLYPSDTQGVQVRWLLDGDVVDSTQITGPSGVATAEICILPGWHTLDAQIGSPGAAGAGTPADAPDATASMEVYAFDSPDVPVDATECGDAVGSVAHLYEHPLPNTREILRYVNRLEQYARIVLDGPGGTRVKRFLATSAHAQGAELIRVYDQAAGSTDRTEARRVAQEALSASMRRHRLLTHHDRVTDRELLGALSRRVSGSLVEYVQALFRGLDEADSGRAVDRILGALGETGAGSWTLDESRIALESTRIVTSTLQYFLSRDDGGQDAWSAMRFDADPGGLVSRVDTMAPARAALSGYLHVIVDQPRGRWEAASEVAGLTAVLAAVEATGAIP